MISGILRPAAPLALAVLCFASPALAQDANDVKSDVLSALSTPLPITIVGPLMTPDVEVVAEGDGFRATLKNTTLMGLFPIGEVSMQLTPIDDETYRIGDLRFPGKLDFPGMAVLEHGSMELEGTWSSESRSYSDLKWVIRGMKLAPEGMPNASIEIGELSFDVAKANGASNTESRFLIAMREISVTGLGPDDVKIGAVQAHLTANGKEPVDLYSVLRETILRSNMSDGGAGLQALAASLLGKTYESVSLELSADDFDISGTGSAKKSSYFRAKTLALSAKLDDVAPREWGAADISLRLNALEQQGITDDGTYSVGEARVRLLGAELPVADMYNAVIALNHAERGMPLKVSDLLDGFANFGKIEIATDGRDAEMQSVKRDYSAYSDKAPYKEVPGPVIGYDSWAMKFSLADFNRNEGSITFLTDLSGGRFVPNEGFNESDLAHIEAWFPLTLKVQSTTSNLNEAFLKKLFTDVSIYRLDEPTEIIAPLVLYASSAVFDVSTSEDVYETKLFRVSRTGNAKVYPAAALGFLPIEGEGTIRLKGYDNLQEYLGNLMNQDPMFRVSGAGSTIISVLTVMRNLATEPEQGTYEWKVARPDIDTPEVSVNGVTFRYPPELFTSLPMIFAFGSIGGFH